LGNIDFKTGLMIAAGGIVGAQVGPIVLQSMSEQNFKRFFVRCVRYGRQRPAVGPKWLFAKASCP